MNTIKNILYIFIFYSLYIPIRIITLLSQLFKIKKITFTKKNSVLFLENFPIENAGYQNRSKKWSEIIREHGYKSNVKTIFRNREKFEKHLPEKYRTYSIISIFIRAFHIFSSLSYKTVVVRRELLLFNDYGNLFMEKLLFNIHSNVILDFDDDIASAKLEGREIKPFGKILMETNIKFSRALKLYRRYIVCSNYLKEYLLDKNNAISSENILVIPTCIEVNDHLIKDYSNANGKITIGWIGGNLNQRYLNLIVNDLNKLSKKYEICLLVISGKPFENHLADFEIKNIKWSLKNQEPDLLKIDIGIMPLLHSVNEKGKCGFKLLQYMSLGIVSLADSITINNEIIEDGKNGFLVNENNWYSDLEKVLSNRDGYNTIGKEAKQTVTKYYSFEANSNKYIDFVTCVE